MSVMNDMGVSRKAAKSSGKLVPDHDSYWRNSHKELIRYYAARGETPETAKARADSVLMLTVDAWNDQLRPEGAPRLTLQEFLDSPPRP
jgi:hypothetical protein